MHENEPIRHDSSSLSSVQHHEHGHRNLILTASEIYDKVNFETNGLYNEPAPEPWVAFVIGGVFTLCAAVLWIKRVMKLFEYVGKERMTGMIRLRCCCTAYIDNDEPFYTIAKM